MNKAIHRNNGQAKKISVRFRLLVPYLLILSVAFIAIITISSNVVEEAIIEANIQSKQTELSRISYELTEDIESMTARTIYNTIVSYARTKGSRILVLNNDYIVVADSASLYNGYYLPYDEAKDILENASSRSYGFHQLENKQTGIKEWTAYYAQPVSANGLNRGVIIMAVSIQQSQDIVSSLRQRQVIALIAVLTAVGIVWMISTSLIIRPVLQLTNVMKTASSKTFEKRVDIKAKGEFADLVDAFNRMGSELNAHDKIRDRFVADASHELKSPLASMKALSESILYCGETPPPELMMDFMRDIDSQVDRLDNIVQDLLMVARDASSDVQYNMETLNFSQITTDLVNFMKPVADKKGLELSVSTDANVNIFGDKLRIERVVTNLVDNAIKYTEKGSIEVKLRRERRDAVLSVKDTGIGIPEESMSQLFMRFYRVDKARSRATGGTGLGLSMVDEIVSRHSGTVLVKSKLGQGSEFIVRIPMC